MHHTKHSADIAEPVSNWQPHRPLIMRLQTGILLTMLLMPLNPAQGIAATSCNAESGATRVALLELYTSEGCDSCPPTDRWFSTLPQRGHTPQHLLALAFHVDYWNYLGWKDPYAKATWSARQRAANHRNKARFVYTPQLLLDGADYRRGLLRENFAERLAGINRQKPGAQIRMSIDAGNDRQHLQGLVKIDNGAALKTAQTYIAIYENNLVSDVVAGENRGKKLHHDFVVRELHGPFAADADGKVIIDQNIRRDRSWKTADLNLAVFVQDALTGRSLQALNLRWCGTN